MLGNYQAFDEVPWFWSDQYGVNLQTAGDPRAGDVLVIRGDTEGMSFTAFSITDDRVLGVIGVNRPRDVRATMTLIEHSVPVEATALCDDNVDLRQLAKQHLVRPATGRITS
jgi:3-phenylpropionate/trans-cinnamate dioxygenase ferredoxin reductase subunit